MATQSPPHPPSSNVAPSPEPTASHPNRLQKSQSGEPQHGPRRGSFSFLRRQKSKDGGNGLRSASGSKMGKKQKALAEEQLRQQQAIPAQPPRLPTHAPLPQMNTFGGDSAEVRPDSIAIMSNRLGSYSPAGSRVPQGHGNTVQPPYGVPVPPIPGPKSAARNTSNGGYVDPYARTESMTHRGRYSYASSAVSTLNSPRRVRRRKDPTPFNILVIGAKNSGKTSFISFLRNSLQLPAKKRPQTPSSPPQRTPPNSTFTSEYLETEIDGERIGLTLWDSQGLEKNVVDLQLREMASFLESKFEETFTEEQKVVRSPGVRDSHIHCVFLILDPIRLDANIDEVKKGGYNVGKAQPRSRIVGILDEAFDLQVLRTLQGKTTVIPIVSKADTITTAHMNHLKKAVWDSLKQAKLDPLEALAQPDSEEEDEGSADEGGEDAVAVAVKPTDEEAKSSPMLNKLVDQSSSDDNDGEHSDASSRSTPNQSPSKASSRPKHGRNVSTMSATLAGADEPEKPYLPLSIISPDSYEPGAVGRRFPWGFADPYDAAHCDFVKLKETVFHEWRAELREVSRERWYEGWRTSRLNRQQADKFRSGPPPSAAAGGVPPPPVPPGTNGRPRFGGNAAAMRAASSGGSPYRNPALGI